MSSMRAALLIACGTTPLLACDGELPLFARAIPASAGAAGGLGASGGTNQGTGNQAGSAGSGGLEPRAGGGNGAGGTAGGPGGLLLIDDVEDGDSRAEGFGWWYPTNDNTSSQGWGFEPVVDRASSKLAVRTHGSGFMDWGAILGVTLRESGSLDASQQQALWFWARAQPGAIPHMWAQLVDTRDTFSFQVELTDSWAEYHVPFTSFRSKDGAQPDPSQLVVVQFLFPPEQNFDVWFDDLAFGP